MCDDYQEYDEYMPWETAPFGDAMEWERRQCEADASLERQQEEDPWDQPDAAFCPVCSIEADYVADEERYIEEHGACRYCIEHNHHRRAE